MCSSHSMIFLLKLVVNCSGSQTRARITSYFYHWNRCWSWFCASTWLCTSQFESLCCFCSHLVTAEHIMTSATTWELTFHRRSLIWRNISQNPMYQKKIQYRCLNFIASRCVLCWSFLFFFFFFCCFPSTYSSSELSRLQALLRGECIALTENQLVRPLSLQPQRLQLPPFPQKQLQMQRLVHQG